MAPKTEVNEYELARQEKIAKNQALLRSLALDAASAGLAPKSTPARTAAAKSQKKKAAPKKEKEPALPTRTSSRLRGIVADSEVAKRKAEEQHEAQRQVEQAKRQRISGDLSFGDIALGGKAWDQHGNFLSIVGPAKPYERTFSVKDEKEIDDKQMRALRERMSGLALWEEFEPNDIKMTPERIYTLGFHPTTDKPLVFAGDKMGTLGICDCSPSIKQEIKQEEDDEEESDAVPNISMLKIHTRTISALQFSPTDPNALFTASYDSSIRKMDLAKGVAIEVYAPSDSSIDEPLSGVQVSQHRPDTLYFTTLSGAFGIHDMRAPNGGKITSELLQLSEKKIGGFSLHPLHPHFVATASLDRTVKIWDMRKMSGKNEERLPSLVGEHESKLSVSHAAFNAAGQVATTSYDDTIKIYDFADCSNWKPGHTLDQADMKPATVVRHNNQTGRWVTILRPQWQQNPQDGLQRFCLGNMNRFVDVYAADGTQLAQLGDDNITAVPAVAQFHPTQDWIAGGTASGKLCLWM